MVTPKLLLIVALVLSMSGCSYLGNSLKQAGFSALHKHSPAQRVYKHMLQADNFFVFGKIENGTSLSEEATAVVAVSSLYQASEVVDVSHFSRNTFYGLTLPAGEYPVRDKL